MLHRILPFYVRHLERHPESLLCKFFSCTALRLYRQTIYFVVRQPPPAPTAREAV